MTPPYFGDMCPSFWEQNIILSKLWARIAQVSRPLIPQKRRPHATTLFFRDFSPYNIVSSKFEYKLEPRSHLSFSIHNYITRHLSLNTLEITSQFLAVFTCLITTPKNCSWTLRNYSVPLVESIMPTATEKQLQRLKENRILSTLIVFCYCM